MKRYSILLAFMVLQGGVVFSQGCSDAGICSLNSYPQENNTFKNVISVSPGYAVGDADVTYITGALSYTRIVNPRWTLNGRVTYSQAEGSFGTRGQFGDAFATASYTFSNKEQSSWAVNFGAKFPFTQSNLKINGFSLPMDYQASLGTFDALAGVNYMYGSVSLYASVQYPVVNINKNSYIAEFSGTDDFTTTNLFERKPDALLKGEYNYSIGRFYVRPSALFIYHLGEDSYEDIFGNRQEINGSEGLTVNGVVSLFYNPDNKNSIELLAATPFVVRKERPDGLTRGLVLTISYNYKF
jgi:hypothetical protein